MRPLPAALAAATIALFQAAGPARAADIEGTPGPDRLRGPPEVDTIRGLAGNDTLLGRGSDDFMNGNEGDDTVIGGPVALGGSADR